MWLDLKKCTFVIFVITMFSLLAVQPAFSLESDFVSTGNGIVGTPTTTSYADLLNGNIDKENNPQGLKFDNVSIDRVTLHQNKDNVLDSPGTFNINFNIPEGYKFIIEIVTSNGYHQYIVNDITVSINGETGYKINSTDAGVHSYTFFLINKGENSIDMAHNVPGNKEQWFNSSPGGCNIHVEGRMGGETNTIGHLEFYIIMSQQ